MEERRTYRARLRVPFHDLDPLHVVWHGNYMKYFDIARFGLFRNAGIDLYRYSVENGVIFPLIKTSEKYISPLRHDDEFVCEPLSDATVKIVVDLEIRRTADDVVCTKSRSEQAAVKLPDMEVLFEIPADIRKAFGF